MWGKVENAIQNKAMERGKEYSNIVSISAKNLIQKWIIVMAFFRFSYWATSIRLNKNSVFLVAVWSNLDEMISNSEWKKRNDNEDNIFLSEHYTNFVSVYFCGEEMFWKTIAIQTEPFCKWDKASIVDVCSQKNMFWKNKV